jgi:tetratricopeptide (TPR) repeat protein
VRADALHQSGELARILALYDVAEERLTQALAAFRALGNRRGVALTLDLLSATARFQGHYATARGFLQEALPIARELGDPALLRKCLVSLGALATNQGDLNAAPPWLEEALTVARHEGDLVGQVQALCYLGIVATQLGDFVGAEQRLRLAVDANQRLGDLDYWATLFDALAGLAGARGHFRRALRLMGAADRVLHDVGTRSLPPVRQARRDAWLKAAHASLALQAVDAAQREGESLDLDEAVVLALSEDNPS